MVVVDAQYRLTQLMANPNAVSFRPVMTRRAIASRTNIAVSPFVLSLMRGLYDVGNRV